MRTSLAACWGFVGLGVSISVFAACGGATETELFASADDAGASSGASGTSGAGGSSGTSGTSGSSGTSGGTSSSSSSTSSSSSSGGNDGGFAATCKRGSTSDCASDEYCAVTNCAEQGVCAKKKAASSTLSPVCGCDGVTYWNEATGTQFGASVERTGACDFNGGKACTGPGTCGGNLKCSRVRNSIGGCGSPAGLCWGLPDSCSAPAANEPRAQTCEVGSKTCKSSCEAIKDEGIYYRVQSCG